MPLTGCEHEVNSVSYSHEFDFIAKVGEESWIGESYLDFANYDRQHLFLVPDNQGAYLVVRIDFRGIGEYPLSDSSAVIWKLSVVLS